MILKRRPIRRVDSQETSSRYHDINYTCDLAKESQMSFNQLSRNQQLTIFELAARESLARWDLPDASLRLIALRSNAVFAAESPNARYILRVNWPERKS